MMFVIMHDNISYRLPNLHQLMIRFSLTEAGLNPHYMCTRNMVSKVWIHRICSMNVNYIRRGMMDGNAVKGGI